MVSVALFHARRSAGSLSFRLVMLCVSACALHGTSSSPSLSPGVVVKKNFADGLSAGAVTTIQVLFQSCGRPGDRQAKMFSISLVSMATGAAGVAPADNDGAAIARSWRA